MLQNRPYECHMNSKLTSAGEYMSLDVCYVVLTCKKQFYWVFYSQICHKKVEKSPKNSENIMTLFTKPPRKCRKKYIFFENFFPIERYDCWLCVKLDFMLKACKTASVSAIVYNIIVWEEHSEITCFQKTWAWPKSEKSKKNALKFFLECFWSYKELIWPRK